MPTPSFQEDHISQIPALQLLQHLGYTYLTPAEALELRGDKTAEVLLEPILKEQLTRINRIRYKGGEHAFTEGNRQRALAELRNLPWPEGPQEAGRRAFDLLTLGLSLEQSIEGDKKSFDLRFIDWEHPENNVYHVTEEFSVMRSGSREHYRPDIVLFVNGIPLVVIECKRPDKKEPVSSAISQHLRNQQADGIRPLYAYAQVLLSIATHQARYATNGTPEEFWSIWEEKYPNDQREQADREHLHALKNQQLTVPENDRLFGDRFGYVRNYFHDLHQATIQPTEQDRYLYGLCRPDRLLDLCYNFILYDAGIKKIARYQQYFSIKKTLKRITSSQEGPRRGGVIWHTQGSGKSLTMVLLAQAIAREPSIKNPKVVLVTDRVELDDQITRTFQKCGAPVVNATSGAQLAELLEDSGDKVITTVVNKFEAAVRRAKAPLESPEIFVLIDEGHRTQYGTFNVKMMQVLPNACFLAFTGTPLMKKEKSTAAKFGGIIDDYTVDKAVKDGAVVPILYEGRQAFQEVNENPIDNYFNLISEPLAEYQRVDLKRKFARADQLNQADQKIYAIAWDISCHYRDNWQKTHFKAQLVCPNKVSAIRYHHYLNEVGLVSSALLISPPDQREGETSAYGETPDVVKRFWKTMMDEHGNATRYEKNLIDRFKHHDRPEIIIVVDKLLTGFDAPQNTVLYVTRNLKEHTLLQAIARVNRVFPGKDFGYVIDYYGVLSELDDALAIWGSLDAFDPEDLTGTLTGIGTEVNKLPQAHSEVWDIFKTLPNKRDEEAYEDLLRDDALRSRFYDKLSAFARLLKMALSSLAFHRDVPEKRINDYKKDLDFFVKLRSSVKQRYSETVDYKQYEQQIQKLIDKHVQSDRVETITRQVNIFEREAFEEEVEAVTGKAAKADRITSRTAVHIEEKMDEDPVFYKKLSQLLKETIEAYHQRRIDEAEYLNRARELMESALTRKGEGRPEELDDRPEAHAFYGFLNEDLVPHLKDEHTAKDLALKSALWMDAHFRKAVFENGQPLIDWAHKPEITGSLQIDIGDHLIDEWLDPHDILLTNDQLDELVGRCIDVARVRFR